MAFPRFRGAAMLAISALVGFVVSLVFFYAAERRAAVRTVPVVVAAKPISKGTALEPAMLRVVDWPSHLRTFDAASTVPAAAGRLARADFVAGEPILEAKLRRRGERGDLDDLLAKGERAMSVKVNDIIGVPAENFIDHHVDLLLTERAAEGGAGSQLVAERVRVLAVNDTGTADRPQPIRTLTLAVALNQAQAIDDARNLGTLTALLRNPRDAGQAAAVRKTTPRVSEAAAVRDKSPVAPVRRVEVILGNTPATP